MKGLSRSVVTIALVATLLVSAVGAGAASPDPASERAAVELDDPLADAPNWLTAGDDVPGTADDTLTEIQGMVADILSEVFDLPEFPGTPSISDDDDSDDGEADDGDATGDGSEESDSEDDGEDESDDADDESDGDESEDSESDESEDTDGEESDGEREDADAGDSEDESEGSTGEETEEDDSNSADDSNDSDEETEDDSDESDDSDGDDRESDDGDTAGEDDEADGDDETADEDTDNESTDGDASEDDTGEDDADETDDGTLERALVERHVHEAVNEERTAHGLEELEFDEELAEIARAHSEDMAERDYFAHEDPDGNDFADRYEEAGYECRANTDGGSYYTGGENIAYTYFDQPVRTGSGEVVEYTTERELADGIVDQWMNSDGHRENILADHWNNEGIGIYVTDENQVYATQNFC